MMIKILLAGDGGQGIQSIADILAQVSFRKGLFVTELPNYGLEQRGGVSLSYLQISDEEIVYPKFSTPDILLIMSDQARDRTMNYHPGCSKIYDFVVFQTKLKENNINVRSNNIFFLGILAQDLEVKNILTKSEIFLGLSEKLAKKTNWSENKKAFNLA